MKTTIVETTEYNKQTLEALLKRVLSLPSDAEFNWEIQTVTEGYGYSEMDIRSFKSVKISVTKDVEQKLNLNDIDSGFANQINNPVPPPWQEK